MRSSLFGPSVLVAGHVGLLVLLRRHGASMPAAQAGVVDRPL